MRSSLTAQPLTSAARQKFLTSFIDTGFFSPAPCSQLMGYFCPPALVRREYPHYS